MMKLIKAFFFLCLALPKLALAELCESYSEELVGQIGSVKLSGDLCLLNNNYSGGNNGTVNVAYNNFSAAGAFTVDGSVIVQYSSNSISPAANTLTVTYSGGPVTYTIGSEAYEVEFQNLSYSFDGNMNQTSESGNILLNGVKVEAKDTPYNYAKLF